MFSQKGICCRRLVRIVFLAAFVLSASGCASTPAPLPPESRGRLGRVGVVALSSAPRAEFRTFAKGWAAGAAKGGAQGMVDGVLYAIAATLKTPAAGPYAGAIVLINLAVMTTVSATVYGVWGGLEAVPAKTSQQIEQDLETAIGNADLANALAREICDVSVLRPDLDRYAVTLLELSSADTLSACGDLSRQGIGSAVEVQITEAGFRGGSGVQPHVSFYLNARIRTFATSSGTEIYTRDFQYLSRERPFSEWFSDGSRELVSVFSQAMAGLAERIVDELFIVTDFPFGSGLWALPGHPEFGSCWFRPVYPELRFTSLWHSIRNNAPGIQVRYTEVDSLQPLFRWEAFPRPRDRKAGNASVLEKIADVTYDLKIWEAAGDFPDRLVYDVSGLRDPQHRPAFPLKPATKYFWTFRARYKLEGQPQATRWAFSSVPASAPSDYPQRQPFGTCDLDAIPSTNYFRFTTPAASGNTF